MKDILIVEDNAIVAIHLRMFLEINGYKVVGKFAKGLEAISFIESRIPDLILMDIMLDDEINGIDIVRMIRAFTQVPVIFMSALTDQETFDQLEKLSNIKLAKKPFVEDTLLQMIQSVTNS
ncbi:predicted sensory transduction regulatory protein [Leptospira ryugenii]|uniref:Predicted sensory transduction regulatory protein n=1 Tax=Leptospira ryugenii TaxID=1917863 RepID=A0A2P2DVL2_9LEPT|nr:response regulator [Leptospira ryugenii]GBF48655.1 predicted sensory transduction regulatory protein [Leptospira ryugenii]